MEDRGKSNNAPWWDVGGVVQEVCVVVVEEEEEGGRGRMIQECWSVSEQGVERMAVDWRIVDACVERQTREGSEGFGSRGGLGKDSKTQRETRDETRRDVSNKDDSTRPIKLLVRS